MLIAADPARNMRIVAISANMPLHAGMAPHDHTVQDLLGPDCTAELLERLHADDLAVHAPWETVIDRLGTVTEPGAAAHDVCVHAHAGLVLLELEATHPDDLGHAVLAARHLRHALGSMRPTEGGLESLSHAVARSIRRFTGYERVLIYRFDATWSG